MMDISVKMIRSVDAIHEELRKQLGREPTRAELGGCFLGMALGCLVQSEMKDDQIVEEVRKLLKVCRESKT